MKRGKTEVETIKLNGWGPGDILEGQEGNKTDRILIVSMGDEKFVAKWDYRATGEYDRESGNVTLSCREWRKVGRIGEPPAWDGSGLPPVGCQVECSFARDDHMTFHRGVVELRGMSPEGVDMVVVRAADCLACYRSNKHIRPIRSEEDQFVDEMVRDLADAGCEGFTLKHYARILYKAGYRK